MGSAASPSMERRFPMSQADVPLSSPPPPTLLPGGADGWRYVVAGGAWWTFAAAVAAVGLVQIATGAAVGPAALGVGRLHMAYVAAVVLGAAPLPAAGLLLAAAEARGPATWPAWVRLGWWLWNAGLGAGLAAILLGHAGPLPWLAMPGWAAAAVAAGMALWGAGLWRRTWPRGVMAWQWLAAPATLAGPVYLMVGGVLAPRLGGSGQEVAGAAAARGLVGSWVSLLAAAAGAAALPRAAEAPIHGRRLLLIGLAGWLGALPLAALAPVAPDLVPPWMRGPVVVAAAVAPMAAMAVVVALVGVWVGSRRSTPAPAWPGLVTVGLVAMAAASLGDGALAGAARETVRFTAWDPWSALFPPFIGAFLVSLGIGLCTHDLGWRRERAGPFSMLFCALGALPLWLTGLAQAATGAGSAVGRVGAGLRLPWAVAMVVLAGVWLHRVARGWGSLRAVVSPAATAARPTAALIAGAAVVSVSAAILLGVFLPVADPAAVSPSPRTAARVLQPGGPRARGRQAYQSEGCAVCHTQRVRAAEAGTKGLGPATTRGDYPSSGPALAGVARSGPDLAWIGDRYPSRDALAERMAVHSSAKGVGTGAVAFPWLFDKGPGGQGGALIEYLSGLRSGARR